MDTYYSRRARQWRDQYGFTQLEAARCVGVDANTWARWERGERQVPPTALRLLIALDHLWKYEPNALKDKRIRGKSEASQGPAQPVGAADA